MSRLYLLDADVFIQAKNRHYAFDIFPVFWSWLDRMQEHGVIASVIPICEELRRGNDELARWAAERRRSGWFLAVDDRATQEHFAEIGQWVMASGHTEAAKEEFLACADPWLIAKAASVNAVVVTHETYDAKIRRKVKIPNCCEFKGVEWIDPFDMMRRLGARF